VQGDPIKPAWKAPGSKRLKLNHDEVLSSSAFNFNLRRYNECATTFCCNSREGRACKLTRLGESVVWSVSPAPDYE